MKRAYLAVTYRAGRPMAGYYYLPRLDGDRSVRCEEAGGGLVVDFAADGRAIGVEITAPSRFDLETLDRVLVSLGHEPAKREDLSPLAA